jgi:hypothetical protein
VRAAEVPVAGIMESPTWRRWPRGQKFELSNLGSEAETAYREQIEASRQASGRPAFDAARASWAAQYAVQPDDGAYLGELRAGPRTLEHLLQALETSGADRQQTHEAVDRLAHAGLVRAPAPLPPPEPPPRRW